MPTTLNSGLQLPDKGSVDWYGSMQTNYNLLDNHLENTDIHVTAEDKANWNSKQGSLSQAQLDAIAQVATNTSDISALQTGKANASHTHSSSDITDIGDYATKQYVDNSISGLVDSAPNALDTLNELAAALNDDANFASTVTNALATKANSADLATVATSGSYTDLTDKPTIPANTSDLTNDSDFVVSSNLATIATSGDYDDLSNKPSIPTSTSDLINDSNFVDTSNSAVASGITSAKVTSYDAHIADTDIHVTAADKNKWNNGVSQSYVFRYSSTALVASSTNSNTLLDNTDNLKVGDKVIDSSGVLFSITAIDTANSTFTIGTALVDLAQDSDVVHKSGNETISGVKTITDTNLEFKSTSAEYGVSAGDNNVIFRDKNNRQTFKIYNRVFSSGVDNNLVSFLITQKVNNNYYNVNGIQLLANTDNKKVTLRPTISNNNADGLSVSLGSSSNKWADCQTYLINGLTPSSLSLPVIDRTKYVDISGYFTNTGNGDTNTYSVTANGWIYFRLSDISSCQVQILDSGNNLLYGQSITGGIEQILIPVSSGVKLKTQWSTATSVNVVNARFIPCQGNV